MYSLNACRNHYETHQKVKVSSQPVTIFFLAAINFLWIWLILAFEEGYVYLYTPMYHPYGCVYSFKSTFSFIFHWIHKTTSWFTLGQILWSSFYKKENWSSRSLSNGLTSHRQLIWELTTALLSGLWCTFFTNTTTLILYSSLSQSVFFFEANRLILFCKDVWANLFYY